MIANKHFSVCVSVFLGDKETKQQLREEVLLKHQQKLSSQSRSKAEKQQAEKKYLLETMMKVNTTAPPSARLNQINSNTLFFQLEQDVRDNIQKMKEAERQKTTAELEAWQEICEKTNTNEEEEDLKKKGKTNSENIKQPGQWMSCYVSLTLANL